MSSVTASRLPPAEVDCMWWKQGYCARGKTCYFRHDEALAGVDNKRPEAEVRGSGKGKAKATISPTEDISLDRQGSSSSSSAAVAAADPADASSPASAQICAVCFETPDTFGLLINCDHVFCLDCIRNWRSSTTAPLPSNDELKSTSKTCPMCRSHSDFIVPSSVFPSTPAADNAVGGENTLKKEIVDRYLSRLQNIPCRYFTQSIRNSSLSFRPKCRFGNSCHYSHTHPITKEPYIFSEEELARPARRPRRNRGRARFLEEMALMERIFADLGQGFESEDEWGCEEEDDMAFFETGDFGEFGDLEFDPSSVGLSLDLDWDELEYSYGWD